MTATLSLAAFQTSITWPLPATASRPPGAVGAWTSPTVFEAVAGMQTQTIFFTQTRLRFIFPWTRTRLVTRTRFFCCASVVPGLHVGFFAADVAPAAAPKAAGASDPVRSSAASTAAIARCSTGLETGLGVMRPPWPWGSRS